MKTHEVDLTQQTFSKKARFIDKGLPKVRSFHAGTFEDSNPSLDILLVNSSEAACLRKNAIPVSDITDQDAQIRNPHEVAGLISAETQKAARQLVGFVQDTEGARVVLKKIGFKEKKPSLLVFDDPNASY